MTPILGRYGPFFLTSYFVVLSLGTIIALAVTTYHARRLELAGWIDGVLLGGAVALVAGRLGYVAMNQAYFRENPGQAWNLWQGGLTYQAALLTGLLAYILWLRLTQRPIGPYLDLIAPGLAILCAAGWAACWFEGCAYGRETIPGLFAADLPDNFGVMAVRYQTQAAGFMLSALVAGPAAWFLSKRPLSKPASGRLFWLTLVALTVVHAFVGLFRGDPGPLLFGIRVDVAVDVGLIAAGLIVAASRRGSPAEPGLD